MNDWAIKAIANLSVLPPPRLAPLTANGQPDFSLHEPPVEEDGHMPKGVLGRGERRRMLLTGSSGLLKRLITRPFLGSPPLLLRFVFRGCLARGVVHGCRWH